MTDGQLELDHAKWDPDQPPLSAFGDDSEDTDGTSDE